MSFHGWRSRWDLQFYGLSFIWRVQLIWQSTLKSMVTTHLQVSWTFLNDYFLWNILKRPQKFETNFHFGSSRSNKCNGRLFQIFVAFSEYLNFMVVNLDWTSYNFQASEICHFHVISHASGELRSPLLFIVKSQTSICIYLLSSNWSIFTVKRMLVDIF